METPTKKTFVGFGFGPIQTGLFLLEAYASGNFGRFVVAEIDKALVAAVRANGGRYTVNIARKSQIDRCELKGIELYDPAVPADRERILGAIAESDEMATSLPSVKFYDSPGPAGVAGMIADGLTRRAAHRPAVIYAAENNNHAAEFLLADVKKHLPAGGVPASAQGGAGQVMGVEFLNTVIGKMSGVITDPQDIAKMDLATIMPGFPRAILVEEFNHILISRVTLPGFRRGIEVFIEKDDLLPFEEAKLFGHNAIHALVAYLADVKGLATVADAGHDPAIMKIARDAFLNESGAALIRKHGNLGDSLFTPAGYAYYAEDLLDRMTRPTLNDLVSRVGRDHVRKLAYDDRLYGTMHLALEQGIRPVNMAQGAAAGVLSMIKRQAQLKVPIPQLPPSPAGLTHDSLKAVLMHLWAGKADRHADEMIRMTWDAMGALRRG